MNDIREYPRSHYEHIIDEWVFNEIDRKILKRRLLDGVCWKQLSDEVNLSFDHVRKRYYKAFKIISNKI